MSRSSDLCTCGHTRARHAYSKHTKRWLGCWAKVLGASGPGPHETCPCRSFTLMEDAVPPRTTKPSPPDRGTCAGCGERVTRIDGLLCISEAAWRRTDRAHPRSYCPASGRDHAFTTAEIRRERTLSPAAQTDAWIQDASRSQLQKLARHLVDSDIHAAILAYQYVSRG